MLGMVVLLEGLQGVFRNPGRCRDVINGLHAGLLQGGYINCEQWRVVVVFALMLFVILWLVSQRIRYRTGGSF